MFILKELRQITVIGLGLLGGSITLAVLRSFPNIKAVGYTHRAITRRKAKRLAVASEVVDDIKASVAEADIVILATPICTFENIFSEIAGALPHGCIVTDVGSTKVLPHRWAAKRLPKAYTMLAHIQLPALSRGVLNLPQMIYLTAHFVF